MYFALLCSLLPTPPPHSSWNAWALSPNCLGPCYLRYLPPTPHPLRPWAWLREAFLDYSGDTCHILPSAHREDSCPGSSYPSRCSFLPEDECVMERISSCVLSPSIHHNGWYIIGTCVRVYRVNQLDGFYRTSQKLYTYKIVTMWLSEFWNLPFVDAPSRNSRH